MVPITLERILDRIAEQIIESPYTGISPSVVRENQKTIRDGSITTGRLSSELLILFQKDIRANSEDLLGTDANSLTLKDMVDSISGSYTMEDVNIPIQPTDTGYTINLKTTDNTYDYPITNLLSEQSADGVTLNPVNVSQFINIEQTSTIINPEQANEFLDVNIYELLPDSSLRQRQIDEAFTKINSLLPPLNSLNFDINGDGRVDRDDNNEWTGSYEYYLNNSISAPQDNPDLTTIDEESAYITRLTKNANDYNSSKTIESLRNQLNNYLVDIDEELIVPQDDRTEYINKSEGYLKFRNLNQGIIIRNTNQEFVEGLDPQNPTWLRHENGDPGTGFTITMWVRFLDKTSEGTLFNYGNPLRQQNPFGFTLDTFVVSPDTPTGNSDNPTFANLSGFEPFISDRNPNGVLFEDTDTERFVRLVVYDDIAMRTYDSHTASPHIPKSTHFPYPGNPTDNGSILLTGLTNPRVPIDFKEWYFICATFNPSNQELHDQLGCINSNDCNHDHYYWTGNVDNLAGGIYSANTGLGNKCKVEIISRSDLLRARGYKV